MGKIKGFLFAVRHREILMTDLGSILSLSLPRTSVSQSRGFNCTTFRIELGKIN